LSNAQTWRQIITRPTPTDASISKIHQNFIEIPAHGCGNIPATTFLRVFDTFEITRKPLLNFLFPAYWLLRSKNVFTFLYLHGSIEIDVRWGAKPQQTSVNSVRDYAEPHQSNPIEWSSVSSLASWKEAGTSAEQPE
jgi:hypothetical protein